LQAIDDLDLDWPLRAAARLRPRLMQRQLVDHWVLYEPSVLTPAR
jgi:hypothetical protein